MLCWAGHMDRLLAMPPISLWQPQTDICLCIPEWPPNGSRSPQLLTSAPPVACLALGSS